LSGFLLVEDFGDVDKLFAGFALLSAELVEN
jgi:hypothetical protein